jgi:adenylate cyclase
MGMEIERKFLVHPCWRPPGAGTPYVQGYLHIGRTGPSVRVRLAGARAFLTIKGKPQNLARPEFEYAIPADEARELLANFAGKRLIEKTRYRIEHAGHTWEVDVFEGNNRGLILAEVELARVDEQVVLPDWVACEVSRDHRYSNAYLSMHPWPEWSDDRGTP